MNSRLKNLVVTAASIGFLVELTALATSMQYLGLRAEPAGKSSSSIGERQTASEQQVARQIAQAWHCADHTKVQRTQLTFKLTRGGEAYDIHLTKGYSDPAVIKASLRAILFAMPYKLAGETSTDRRIVTCNIDGDSAAPNVQVVFSELTLDESKNASTLLHDVPYQNKQFENDSIMRNWMYNRLSYLCGGLFQFPDSSDIQSEISNTLSHFGLSTANAHDWLSFARSTSPNIVIMRNPGSDIMHSCDAEIVAYFQAWRLTHDKATLSELADAYAARAACEVLAASKADPVFLGTAAVLTNQFNEAKEQYQRAQKNGNAMAGQLLDRMAGTTNAALQQSRCPISGPLVPRGERSDWERVMRWFPVDTETVITFVEPFTSKNSFDPKNPDYTHYNVLHQLQEIVTAIPPGKDNQAAKLLHSSRISVSMHAGRDFTQPSGLGSGTQQGADVIVFSRDSAHVSRQILDELRPTSLCREEVAGTEVLIFDQRPQGLGRRYVSYLCSPCEGVLVNASSMQFLKELLARLETEPKDRALPPSLAEWKQVETGADAWAIRHYDKSHMPFDRSALIAADDFGKKVEDWGSLLDKDANGVVFYGRTDGSICIKFLSSNESVLQSTAEHWRRAISQHDWSPRDENGKQIPIPPLDIKVTVENQQVTIAGKTNIQNAPMVSLLLWDALGYMVNI